MTNVVPQVVHGAHLLVLLSTDEGQDMSVRGMLAL